MLATRVRLASPRLPGRPHAGGFTQQGLRVKASGAGRPWHHALSSSFITGRTAGTDAHHAGVHKMKPLDGVKILDLTRVLAGPFATMNLGDLGAEIIKVERPGVGDDTRAWGPPFVGTESTYFLSVNRNKKSIVVNIKDPKGVKIIKELAAVCDVFVENYVPGKLSSVGLGYEDIETVAPHVIYCSITGYGQTGPLSQRAGYDAIASAISGMMHITGPEDGDPVRPGVAMTDLATGLYACGAIMAGLIQRQRTGKGLFIDCNLLSSQVACLTQVAANYLISQKEARRWGTAHGSIVPYQAFKTKDGYLVVGAGNNQQFSTVCKILNLPELIEDSKYKTNYLRVQNRKQLIKILSVRFEEELTSTWMSLFEGSGVPYGPINNMKSVFEEPQMCDAQQVPLASSRDELCQHSCLPYQLEIRVKFAAWDLVQEVRF